jgi:hypothetical protein
MERIVRLESKFLNRITKLETENARLKARIADVQEGLSIFMAAAEDSLAHVNDLLWPVVDKVFPQLREMKSRMDAVIPPCFADPRADRRRVDKTS